MKRYFFILLTVILVSGCAAMQRLDDEPKGTPNFEVKPGEKINGLEERYISIDLWNKLELGDRAMLVGMENDRMIIFVSDGVLQTKEGKSFPKGRILDSQIQLLRSHKSPPCTSYADSEGNEKWWPKDCPRD